MRPIFGETLFWIMVTAEMLSHLTKQLGQQPDDKNILRKASGFDHQSFKTTWLAQALTSIVSGANKVKVQMRFEG